MLVKLFSIVSCFMVSPTREMISIDLMISLEETEILSFAGLG